jgi:hypothetical protein
VRRANHDASRYAKLRLSQKMGDFLSSRKTCLGEGMLYAWELNVHNTAGIMASSNLVGFLTCLLV